MKRFWKKVKETLDTDAVFATCFLISDIIAISGSFILAYFIRSNIEIRTVSELIDFKTYLLYVATITLIWIIVFWFAKLYHREKISEGTGGFYKLVGAISFGTTLIVLFFFFSENPPFSRLIIVYAFILSCILIFTGRFWVKTVRKALRRYGVGTKKLLIVGNGKQTIKIIQTLTAKKTTGGFELIGIVSERENEKLFTENGFRYLGTKQKVEEIIKKYHPDIVLLTATKKLVGILNLAETCRKRNIEFRFIPDIPRLLARYSLITNIDGIPIYGVKKPTILGWGRIAKRIFDLTFSTISLILLSPILILTAIIIKLSDFGPIFYKQERIGRDEKRFWAYKFRSMRPDADKLKKWTTKNDPRVTKIGKIIRKFSIDELPQLFNVLKGEMSIVGPRPEQPRFVKKFSREIPRYAYRHRVKGGITGWAQVNGLRGDTSIEERVKYDLYYIENWTLLFDIKIILLTIKTILFSQGHTS